MRVPALGSAHPWAADAGEDGRDDQVAAMVRAASAGTRPCGFLDELVAAKFSRSYALESCLKFQAAVGSHLALSTRCVM